MPDVAVGDVYALLVEWCLGQGNPTQAVQLVEQMLTRRVPPGQYLSPEVLAAVQQVMTGVNGERRSKAERSSDGWPFD